MNDFKFALRQLLKNPGFTAVAVLTLALGIGVNTTMFTAFQSLLLRELPYPESDRVVRVFRTSPHSQRWPHSPANFLDYQARNEVFTHLAAEIPKPFNMVEGKNPAERVRGLLASAELFPVLGMQPILGRVYTAAEDRPGQNQVVVLENSFWLRRFAGDSNIIGQTVRLDGETVTVIGVMPPRFHDPMLSGPVDMWRPIAFSGSEQQNRGGHYLRLLARLKPGVSLPQAQAAMNTMWAGVRQDHPDLNPEEGLRLAAIADSMDPKGRVVIWFTLMLAGFVLLIACANLANLQFARTALRTREFAVRGALGAPRGRLFRQILIESLLLALIGGGLGLVLAHWGNVLLSRQVVIDGQAFFQLALNWGVFGFALAAATASGLAFGLFPAWLASRTDVNEALKQGGRGSTQDRSQHRVQQTLVVVEVALALVLLAGAGLVINGVHGFTAMDPGWRVAGLTIGRLNLPDSKYPNAAAQQTFITRLQDRLAAIPGYEKAAIAWNVPVTGFNSAGNVDIEGLEASPRNRQALRFFNGVTPDYFEILGMRLITGRYFTAADTADRPAVVIINEALARAYWPNESPLGHRIGSEEIVGVVNDVRFPADPSEPVTRFQTYRPFAQDPKNYLAIVLLGNVSVDALRKAVAEVDSDLPLNKPGLVSTEIATALGNIAVGGWIFATFAGLGLSLAALGIYGVIAGFVVRRTHEIGVRMALGAQVREVLALVVGKGLRLASLGAVLGLAGAFGLGRVLISVAPELKSNHPLTILFVASILIGVALVASWLPARRAARVDPMVALRTE